MLRIMWLIITIFIQADVHIMGTVDRPTNSTDIQTTLSINESQRLTDIKKNTQQQKMQKISATKNDSKKCIESTEQNVLKEKTITEKAKISKQNNSAECNTKKNISQNKTDFQKSILTQKNATSIQSPKKETQKITIVNSVTPEKTAYTHWSGTYQPEFIITVNGKPINMSSKEYLEVDQKNISVSYHAQFPANHSSEDTWVVYIEQNTRTITLDFDWHAKPRLQIDQSS